MNTATLLHQPRLSLITRETDGQLLRIRNTISQPVMVDGRGDVESVLGVLARSDAPSIPKTLDLIGHSTPDRSLLVLGDWVIDGTSSKVLSFFRGLVDSEVLARISVTAIRLLGCETGVTQCGRYTLITLADILETEAFGTTQMIGSSSYDETGFCDDHALVAATELRREPMLMLVKRGGEPYHRMLDVDSLPASPLGLQPAHPRRIADLTTAQKLLALVRRDAGAQMPGLLTPPLCELALPSGKPGWFHRLQVLSDGEFVRVYPDGDDRPGVVFPVDDPRFLRVTIETLPRG